MADDWVALWGRITLGDHVEGFAAPIDFWRREDYERQWLEAARRLLGGSDRTGFFTAVYWTWWTMWREGERVFVHEEIILEDRFAGPYDGTAPYHIIRDRTTHSEDGDEISTWEVALDDVRAYVKRREAAAFPV